MKKGENMEERRRIEEEIEQLKQEIQQKPMPPSGHMSRIIAELTSEYVEALSIHAEMHKSLVNLLERIIEMLAKEKEVEKHRGGR
jgi:hypothetical protein